MWRFAFADNGIGVPPENVARVFTPFSRLQSRDEHAGTGLGLATCRKIVERHGGKMWVASVPGQGTTFYFTLRAAPVPQAPMSANVPRASNALP
jgi:signal transduction histidine kinase